MKNLPNGDRGNIVLKLLALKHSPCFTEEERRDNRIIHLAAYKIRGGQPLNDECREFLCRHKDVVITDKNEYRIESPHNVYQSLVYHVYYKNNCRATFYQEHRAVEYVAMIKGLL